MGKLDPTGAGRSSAGSQPCLLVAQTVSNRRKRQHAAVQHQQQEQLKTRPATLQSKSSKKSFQRSESFQQPQAQAQPHFFVNTQMDESATGIG